MQKFKFLRRNRDYYYSFRIPYGQGDIIMELGDSEFDKTLLLTAAESIIKDVIDLTLDRFNGVHLKLDDIAAFMSKYASVNALGFESNGTHYKTSMYRRAI
jgi:hypothetical protein